MTNKDIKLEIAKIALNNGLSIESAKVFYDWIIEESKQEIRKDNEIQLNDIPIEEFACKTNIRKTILRRCYENNIETVGNLIKCGGYTFSTFKNVGEITVLKINDALRMHYGIKDWYKYK